MAPVQSHKGPRQTGNYTDNGQTDAASDELNARPPHPERGGIDVFDSLLVRQPIAEGQTRAVRNLLADWAAENSDGDAHTLLPFDGVTLVTLFLLLSFDERTRELFPLGFAYNPTRHQSENQSPIDVTLSYPIRIAVTNTEGETCLDAAQIG